MTKVNGSNVTFLNSACVASDPEEMSTVTAIPRQGLNKISPSECQKSRPALPPQQRWVAVAGSSDRPGFSLKPVFSAVKHRNLLLRELQTSLTKRHSDTSKRGSGSRSHSTYSVRYFGHKVFFGDYYPACPWPVPP